MHGLILLWAVGISVTQDTIPDPPNSLDYRDGYFRVTGARKSVEIPVAEKAEEPLAMIEKSGDLIVVWDERGLTVKRGEKTYQSRLEDYPVSIKVLSDGEVRANSPRFASGDLRREAAGLSGSCRREDKLYLLPRWETKDRKPWLEVLLVLDMDDPLPKPRLVGRFRGISQARGTISSELHSTDKGLEVVTISEEEWNLARFDFEREAFEHTVFGRNLEKAEWRQNVVMFVERTTWGMALVGTVAKKDGSRRELMETRGSVSFLPFDQEAVLVRTQSANYVRSLVTGAESRLATNAAYRATDLGLLVFSPSSAPTRAAIYDPSTWRAVLNWPPPPPPARKGKRSN